MLSLLVRDARPSRPASCVAARGALVAVGAALMLGLVGACHDVPKEQGSTCDLVAGSVVVSEIMAAPTADGPEWFEIYNTSAQEIVLDRLTIARVSFTEGQPVTARGHTLRGAGKLAPGGYATLARGELPNIPVYNYYLKEDPSNPDSDLIGESFGELTNSGAQGIALLCGDNLLDTVIYGVDGDGDGQADLVPPSGRSLSFDGSVPPDALINDDAKFWCTGGNAYDGANVGTPGAPNTACGLLTCLEGGSARDIVAPEPGEVVISEVLLNAIGTDRSATAGYNKLWIEVFVAADHQIDLNRIEIIAEKPGDTPEDPPEVEVAPITGDTCARGEPGAYVVVGAYFDPEKTGGVTVGAIADLNLAASFFESGLATLRLEREGVLLDRVTLPVPGSTSPGETLALDAEVISGTDPTGENDDPNAFCYGNAPTPGAPLTVADPGYDPAHATPGAANWVCIRANECTDLVSGDDRPIVPPVLGDLIISEVYGDPAGADINKEWVELYVAAAGPVDLNGLIFTNANTDGVGGLGSQRSKSVVDATCRSVAPGSLVVVGFYEIWPTPDGTIVDNGGITPDAVVGAVSSSSSFFYNAASGLPPAWLAIHSGETLIDEAYFPAALSGRAQAVKAGFLNGVDNNDPVNFCASQVTGVFLNGEGTPGEDNVCDPGPVTPTCEDGVVSRNTVPPTAGSLVITEIFPNPTGTDAGRDWLEVYVASGPVDLNGLEVISTSGGGALRSWTVTSTTCVEGAQGQRLVLSAASGPAGSAYSGLGDFYGSGSSTAKVTLRMSGVELDSTPLPWAGADCAANPTQPCEFPDGRSLSLRPSILTAAGNDALTDWCHSTQSLNGFAEDGSPGVANEACP